MVVTRSAAEGDRGVAAENSWAKKGNTQTKKEKRAIIRGESMHSVCWQKEKGIGRKGVRLGGY